MSYIYSETIKKFIVENVKGRTTKELVAIVNAQFDMDFTESKMKAYKKNHKLKSETPTGLPAGRPTELYPEKVRKFIDKNHIGIGPKDMTVLLNKTFETNYTYKQLKFYYANNKIDSGLTGQFLKGNRPFNKGIKGVGGWEPTQFKKGNTPHNYKPVGSERVDTDGYVEIKIADPREWKGKHILIWEKANGPVPKGHAVIFGDGNNRNFDINNLVLVSRKQLLIMNRHKLIQKDTNLTKTGVIIADLYLKIGEKKKVK